VLPGQKYSAEDILRILARRAWLIVVTLVLVAAASVVVSKRLPNQYRSETLIMLVPQRISDSYVKAAVTTRIEDRLATLEDQILSRSRLERIILDLDLYREPRRTLPMEDVVQRMREDITIKIEGKESFRVSFVSNEARTAQTTTTRLASLFIEENLRDRENLAEDTNQFLDSQLEDAKRRLIEHEKKLEEYRSRYGGELPSQATANLQAIQNAQVQLQVLAESADRARERRLLLERQVIDLQAEPPQAATTPQATASPDSLPSGSTDQQLQLAQARLQVLLSHDKPDHPDVRMMERTIRDLEGKLEAESRRLPAQPQAQAPTTERPPTPAERMQQARLRDLKLQMDDIDRQLAEKQKEDLRLRAVVSEYQAKVDAVPRRESDLVELTRDYTTLQTTYQSLLAKREDAKLASNLERRNIGEQFKILDPARIPERPFSPNRMLIDLGGAAAGLVLGALLVGFLEYRDSSFKCEEDVIRLLNVRVLALVPIMISDFDRRTSRRRTAFAGIAAVLLLGAVAALVVWQLQL
jgi:polysaccharide chain length determinant protein (PEP-CTERM system associated)